MPFAKPLVALGLFAFCPHAALSGISDASSLFQSDIGRPARRHEKNSDSKVVEAQASGNAGSASSSEADALDAEMNDLLNVPLADPRAERHRLAAKERLLEQRSHEASTVLANQQREKNALEDMQRRQRAQAIAEQKAQEELELQERHAAAEARRAASKYETGKRLHREAEARAVAREAAKEHETLEHAAKAERQRRIKAAEEQEHRVAAQARAAAKELEAQRIREHEARKETLEAERKKHMEEQIEKMSAAAVEVEERRAAKVMSDELRAERAEQMQAVKDEFLISNRLHRLALHTTKELREDARQAHISQPRAKSKKAQASEIVGPWTLTDLAMFARAFKEEYKNPYLAPAVENATLEAKGELARYVRAIRDRVTALVLAATNASTAETVSLLSEFGSDLVTVMRHHDQYPKMMVRKFNLLMPEAVAVGVGPMVKLFSPQLTMPAALTAASWSDVTVANSCQRFTEVLGALTPTYVEAQRIHTNLNNTLKAFPDLASVEPAFTPEMANVAERMMQMAYIEAAAVEETSQDIVARVGPIVLSKLRCALGTSAATMQGPGLLISLIVAAAATWLSF